MWAKFGLHPCWRVQKALNDSGTEYELVKAPLRRSKRTEVIRLTGQDKVPVIEFEDGTTYRAESRDMKQTILDGKLEGPGVSPAPG